MASQRVEFGVKSSMVQLLSFTGAQPFIVHIVFAHQLSLDGLMPEGIRENLSRGL